MKSASAINEEKKERMFRFEPRLLELNFRTEMHGQYWSRLDETEIQCHNFVTHSLTHSCTHTHTHYFLSSFLAYRCRAWFGKNYSTHTHRSMLASNSTLSSLVSTFFTSHHQFGLSLLFFVVIFSLSLQLSLDIFFSFLSLVIISSAFSFCHHNFHLTKNSL